MDPFDRDLIAAHPELFSSFFALPTLLDRNYLFELRRFLLWASWQSRWLLVALKSLTGDVLKGFDAWQDWAGRTARWRSPKKIADYYQNRLFHRDFLRFMRREMAPKYPDREHIINTLVDHDASLLSLKRQNQTACTEPVSNPITLNSRPVKYDNMEKVRTVEADYEEILRCLRRGIDCSEVRRGENPAGHAAQRFPARNCPHSASAGGDSPVEQRQAGDE